MIERWRDISLEPRLGPVVGVLVSFYPGHFHWRHTLALIVAGGGGGGVGSDTYISVTRRQFGQIDGGLSGTSLSRSASPDKYYPGIQSIRLNTGKCHILSPLEVCGGPSVNI